MQKRKSYENDLILKQNNKKLRKKILEFLSIQVHQITVCIVHRKGTFSSFLLPKLLNCSAPQMTHYLIVQKGSEHNH
jgi:hypothetical protein